MLKQIKKHRWLVVTLAALIIFISVICQLQSFDDCVCDYQNHKNNQTAKEDLSLLSVPFTASVGCLWSSFSKNSDAIIALFTIVIGVFTSLLFLDAKEKGRKELRAYLGFGGGEVFVLPVNKILRAVVEVKNFGTTPAFKVRPSITGELREVGDSRPFDQPEPMPHTQPIAPTMHWTFGHEFTDMSQADLLDVLNDKKLVYVWGSVTYEDIYGEPHTFSFRLRNVVKIISQTEAGTAIHKWTYYPENEGNDST